MTNRTALPRFFTVLLALFVPVVPADAGSINSISAFSPHQGETIWREQVRVRQASKGDRDLTVIAVPSVVIYGFTERWTGFLNVPYLYKSLDVGSRSRGDNGLGDIRTFVKYRLYTKDQPTGSHRLGLFSGLDWPTGEDHKRDSLGLLPQPLQLGSGSFDPFFGVVWTTQLLSWELDADIAYKLNTKANDFEFGDELSHNISFQYRVWPFELPDVGVPSFVYGVLELNGIQRWRNKSDGATVRDSGGYTLFLSPGLQWVSRQWVVEASVQLPIVQELNGSALKTDYVAALGFRFRF